MRYLWLSAAMVFSSFGISNGQASKDSGTAPKVVIPRHLRSGSHRSDAKSHQLPETDRQYTVTKGYIEEEPVLEYQWADSASYEAFLDMKFGVRIHWGLYSLIRQEKESWPFLKMDNTGKQAYMDLYKKWNPVGFDANEWMNLFQEAGMKMFAITTKHHEGFSLYDTKTRVKRRVNYLAPGGPVMEDCDVAFSVMETPHRRDVIKELTDAARQRDIKIDLYYSHPDWYDADFRPYVWHPLQVPSSAQLAVRRYPFEPEGALTSHYAGNGPILVADPTEEEVARMMKRHREQLEELLTNYGKIDMLCLDMWLGPKVWPQLRETMIALRKIQPNVMFRARGIGNYGDYYTPEGFVPGSQENTSVPWFVIYPLGRTFSYESDPAQHKGSTWVIHNLIDCAAKGGNFMVGVGPDENGKYHPTVVEQFKEVGAWLKRYGSSIYKTRARNAESWKEGDHVRYTRSKSADTVYLHLLQWPVENRIVLEKVKPLKGSSIVFMGNGKRVKWKRLASGAVELQLPAQWKEEIPLNQQQAFSFIIREN